MKNQSIYNLLFTIALLSSTLVSLHGQEHKPRAYDACNEFFSKNPAEKVYLHTDRDTYATNDTIWFAIYLTNAHTFTTDASQLRNIYVELIDENKEIKVRNLIPMQNGISYGDFDISRYIDRAGKYRLRAYTEFQQNFGNNFLYEKKVLIHPIFETSERRVQFTDSLLRTKQPSTDNIDLQFLPEGGYLTSGINNVLAFKALETDGKPVDVTGTLYDESNEPVAIFQTSRNGMGKMVWKPEAGKSYYAKINGHSIQYPLPSPVNQIQMSVTTNNDSVLVLRLRANTVNVSPTKYHLVVSCRGFVKYHEVVLLASPFQNLRIPFANLESGVNQITLLTEELVPFNERLVFIDKKDHLQLKMIANKEIYQLRDRVVLTLQATNAEGTPAEGSFSVSVTDRNLCEPHEKYPENIFSYLMLSSDLKGNIENPSYYFSGKTAETKADLDLLMLTQGWRQYIWAEYPDSLPAVQFPRQYGIDIHGSINRLFKDEGLKDGDVTLTITQDKDILVESTTTDDKGKFVFRNMVLPDSIKVLIQCKGKFNSKLNEVLPVRTFSTPSRVNEGRFFNLSNLNLEESNRIAYRRYVEDKAFHPDKYDILLDEIVISKKIEAVDVKDEHFRPYFKADRAFIPGKDDENYINVLFYLSRNMGSVHYNGQDLTISTLSAGQARTPLLMLDGIEVSQQDIENLPMEHVDKVEVLNSPVNTASLGDKGWYGVIAVYTKRHDQYISSEYRNGMLTQVLRGYYQSRKFYQTRYTEQTETKQPDNRITLFWAPIVKTNKDGQAQIEFYTNNRITKLHVQCEGISNQGKPGTTEFEVSTKK